MVWGYTGFLWGNLPAAVYDTYSKDGWVSVPRVRTGSMEVEISDSGNPDGFLGFGWLYAGAALRLNINYAMGQRDVAVPNSSITRTPGGYVFVEPGQPSRRIEVPLDYIDYAAGQQEILFDMAMRAQHHGPILWLPDTADPALCFRYGGCFQLRGETGLDRAFWDRSSRSSLTLESVTR